MKRMEESKFEPEEALLDGDVRWALVQRIIASEDFQRASQLQKILLYAARLAILRPDEILSEYEVACSVLGRRPDFNPSNDNIVRAQFSHLRRKLQHYYDTEGRDEPLALTVPKGNYIPVFTPHQAQPCTQADPKFRQDGSANAPTQFVEPSSIPAQNASPWWRNWKVGLAVLLNTAFLSLMFMIFWFHYSVRPNKPKDEIASLANPFVQFLARSEGDVMIVVPDTSLAAIQNILSTKISTSDYISTDFPQRQVAMLKDPSLRSAISAIGGFRTTTITEAMIAFDFKETLGRIGTHAALRYARDLHMNDLSVGNSVLIGGPNSDPWVSLFTDGTNFRHVDDLAKKRGYFENVHPLPGELTRYVNTQSRESIGYVDVALTQNPTQSGYVLLINGSDSQGNEAAARFLLHGRLPKEMSSVLDRKDIHNFEFFLRGEHLAGEADNSFELVALRFR
jgi:hypothetical protein